MELLALEHAVEEAESEFQALRERILHALHEGAKLEEGVLSVRIRQELDIF